VIDEDELDDLQEFAKETMVQLEMCFPLNFFGITEHLIIHMVDQIRALGALYLRNVDLRAFHVNSKSIHTKSC